MKIIHFLLFVLLISCAGKQEKNASETNLLAPKNSEQQIETTELLENGLLRIMKGDWLTTILPDSILKTREILRWKSMFYGNLLKSINENDTLIIRGNMDWLPLKYEVIANNAIQMPEWNNTRVVYSAEKNLIFWSEELTGQSYRKIDKDFLNIMSDEKLLMDYVINLLFNEDYLPREFAAKIKYISLGLETYTPFTFDAIGIENQNGKLDYYGWKFSGDTLNLYKTSYTYDDDSGFISYKLEEIDRQYIRNN